MKRTRVIRQHYTVFLLMALGTLALGIFLCPDIERIRRGLLQIVMHPSLLPTDYMTVGGHIGVSFVHAGLMMLTAIAVFAMVGAKLQGLQVAALMMVFAFAFCGKNLLNIWPLVIGVFIEAKVANKDPAAVVPLAFFAGSLSPLVSVLAVGTPLLIHAPLTLTVPVAIVAGVIAGMLIGRFAAFVRTLHRGTILYNGAMSSGIVGILTNFLLIAMGLGHDKLIDNIYIVGFNKLLGWIVFGYAMYFLIAGLYLNKGFKGLGYFVGHTFNGTDFVYQFSMGKTLINMSLVCLAVLLYVLVIPRAQLNGPVIGGLFTIVGFAANGVTLPSMLPALAGVFMGSFLTGGVGGALVGNSFAKAGLARVASRSMVIAAMFSGGFSPMTKLYGPSASFAAGMLFSITVTNIAPLHGWMINYHNGFSMGLVAMLFLPVIQIYSEKDYVYRVYKGYFGKQQTEEHSVLKKTNRYG